MSNSVEQIPAIKLFPQQEEALNRLKAFLQSKDSVFILRGYAGTGKTTMIKALIPEIYAIDKTVSLMAPTGRAAKILKGKTCGDATTIHKAIYAVDKLTAIRHDENGELIETLSRTYSDKESVRKDDIMEFWFGIKKLDTSFYRPDQYVFIVDESSMIGSKKSEQEVYHFGTDILLNDLLTYAQLGAGAKIVFVGDPAQLPPIGENFSAALSEDFFTEKGWGTQSFELTEVIRQKEGSLILQNAMAVRDLLSAESRNELSFATKEGEVESVTPIEVVNKYIQMSPEPTFDNQVVVCYSNRMAKGYNDAIRNYYYPGKTSVQVGDVLQVVRNLYFEDGSAIFNGDFVKVLSFSDSVESQSAPVWVSDNGTRVRRTITLTFRDATVISEDGMIVKIKILDSLLDDVEPRLTPVQHTALYINFRMRHPDLRKNDEVMAKALMRDPYYNALNVKYGYAITGHKSQGGDWDTVFVDYSLRTGLYDDSLRWMYTATTRAKSVLYGVNMPNIHPMDKLHFASIIKANKVSGNAISIADAGYVSHFPMGASNFQKAKCLSIVEELKELGCSVERVEQQQYKDRYYIQTSNGVERYDCIYNGAGIYTVYTALDKSEHNSSILQALRSERCYTYRLDYTPSFDILADLYAKMCSLCDELGAEITNVVEDIKQYNVQYFLKTSGKFSQIKFYFDKNRFITYGQPSSDLGEEDELLKEIIKKLG